MVYALSFNKQALKELEKVNEPFYSSLKTAITNLTNDPRPNGYIKQKEKTGKRKRVGNNEVI